MTPITAWFTFRWGRDQAREQMRDAQEAEAERFSKHEEARRVQRGMGKDGTGRWRDVVLLERRSEIVGKD